MLSSKISNSPQNNVFAASFLRLGLRGSKETYMEVGESKVQGEDWITG